MKFQNPSLIFFFERTRTDKPKPICSPLFPSWGHNEPCCEKTGLRGFRPGPTQTGPYSHRRWLSRLEILYLESRGIVRSM